MNLATMAIKLFLKNPPRRAFGSDAPMMPLPNGRALVFYNSEYDGSGHLFNVFVRDEIDVTGVTLKKGVTIEEIPALIAEQASLP